MAATTANAVPCRRSPVDRRKLIAFFAMGRRRYMSILDIQIVSASLSKFRRVFLPVDELPGADILSDCGGHHDPLIGTLARILSTRVLFTVCAGGFTLAFSAVRHGHQYRADDHLPCTARLYRRWHDSIRVRSGLHDLSTFKRSIVSPIIALSPRLRRPLARRWAVISAMRFPGTGCFWSISCGIFVTLLAWTFIDFDKAQHSLMKRFDWWGLAPWRFSSAALSMCLRRATTRIGSRTSISLYGTVVMVVVRLYSLAGLQCGIPVVD